MIEIFNNLGTSFVLGLLTPLTAVCVLPLYPGFLSFLSNKIKKEENREKSLLLLGVLVVAGVISFMMIIGFIFTTFFQASLTNVINIVSPIAFSLLLLISLFLIFDLDIGKLLPRLKTPTAKNPYLSAFIYGFFFGAIVIPCSPLFIATLFARTLTGTSYILNLLSFLFFGLGIGFPLLLFAILTQAKSQYFISLLLKYRKKINLFAGIFMMIVSLYYLIFVFRIYELII